MNVAVLLLDKELGYNSRAGILFGPAKGNCIYVPNGLFPMSPICIVHIITLSDFSSGVKSFYQTPREVLVTCLRGKQR